MHDVAKGSSMLVMNAGTPNARTKMTNHQAMIMQQRIKQGGHPVKIPSNVWEHARNDGRITGYQFDPKVNPQSKQIYTELMSPVERKIQQ